MNAWRIYAATVLPGARLTAMALSRLASLLWNAGGAIEHRLAMLGLIVGQAVRELGIATSGAVVSVSRAAIRGAGLDPDNLP